MALTQIQVRSPRILSQAGVALDAVKLELFIWNDPDSIPSLPSKTLEKPVPSDLITTVNFDISPYIREFIEHVSYTEVTTLAAMAVGEYCYCTAKMYLNAILQTTYTFACFDGFGYFEEGYNPAGQIGLLTDGTYYVEEGGNCGSLSFFNDLLNPNFDVKYTGLTSGGVTTITTTTEFGHVPYVFPTYDGEGNKVELLKNSVIQNTYFFKEICEPKYVVYNCDFVNKFGAWQRLVFFKASQQSMDMTNTEFNLMTDNVNYNTSKNVRQVFNVNATEKIVCNTGWVLETYNEVIKQLLLSEKILLNGEPVITSTKQIELQKNINDKNINYRIEFNYAHPMLNYNV